MPIVKPNYTQFPNELLDKYMRDLSGSEFKVISLIIRKTFGFQDKYGKRKTCDKISISQIMEFAGISKPIAISAVRVLEEKHNLIRSVKKHKSTTEYHIVFESEEILQNDCRVKKLNPSGKETLPNSGKSGKETLHTKESNINKLTKEKKPALRRIISDRITEETSQYTKEPIDWKAGRINKALKNIEENLLLLPEENRLDSLNLRIENLKNRAANDKGFFWAFTILKLAACWEELGLSGHKKTGIDTKLRDEILERHGIK